VNIVQTQVNWFGLAGGVTTIAVTIVSLFYPWWLVTAGENLVRANVSPLNTNFSFLGTAFTIPLISAVNIASSLTLAASGITMLIYAIIPTRAYSKHLLGFAYKKPLFAVVFFVIVLFALTVIIHALFGLNVPLVGSSFATLPETMTDGVTIRVLLSAGFQLPFWLAAAAAGLCLAARLYHKRVATPAQVSASAR
jgi:hypothetical protein